MKSSSHATKRFSLPVVPERNHLLLMVAFSFLVGSLSIFYLSIGRWMWLIFLMGILIGVIQKRLGLRCGVAIVLCSFSLGALYANTAFQMSMPRKAPMKFRPSSPAKSRRARTIAFPLC